LPAEVQASAGRIVNRRQRRRRAAEQQPRPGRREIAQSVACPDCDAEVMVTEIAPRVFQGELCHDETCPWFDNFAHNGGLGVRFVGEDQKL
jgi:hypothetical protein